MGIDRPGSPPVEAPQAGTAQSGAFGTTGPPPGDSVPPPLEVPILMLWVG